MKSAIRRQLIGCSVVWCVLLLFDAALSGGETSYGYELTQTINIQRQEQLQKMCNLLELSNTSLTDITVEQMDHMLIDKEHKFFYCYVPKVSPI
jgi:hypothetical protein